MAENGGTNVDGGATGGTSTSGAVGGAAGGTGTGTGTGGTAPAAPAWHGLTDPVDAAFVTNKGWQNPADVVRSYQGAEKLLGRDASTLLTIPRADDPAGFRAAMSKLGLPETADKYDFGKPPEGRTFDEGRVAWAKSTFHEAGVPASIAAKLVAADAAYMAQANEKAAADYKLAVTADKQTLLAEWGGGHERMMAAAKHAATTLGFTAPMIEAMEGTIGFKDTHKFFAALGQKLGEANFVAGGTPQKFGDQLTPAEAKVQWDAAKLDPNFSKALTDKSHPGHKAAMAKQQQLMSIMFPG